MARVTVEDCVEIVPNRFSLVLLAARRAREIFAGSPLTVDRDNDKNPVIALREIAEQTVDTEELYESIVRSYQRVGLRDATDDELESEFTAASATDDLTQNAMEENAIDDAETTSMEQLLQSEAESQLSIEESNT